MTAESMVTKAEAMAAAPFKRKVKAKKPVWYDPEDTKPSPKKNERKERMTPRLRSSITPGTVLILLSGRFRGKRVVFLKQLKSGTLLITGPFEVNGVPLRRINQRYVIATSVKVDIAGVTIPVEDDSYFAREEQAKKTAEDQFFDHASKGPTVPEKRKEDQKTVDSGVMAAITAEPMLKAYLSAKFSLKNGDRPHEMQF